MRIACLVAFVVVGGGAALADYAPLELRSLFGASDLAVIGTIETVETDVFTMTVDEVVVGSYDGDSITITKFRDWTCASRWTPYERGQHILVFLWRQLSDGVTHYRIRGAGDDGELPIVGSYAYWRGRPISDIPVGDHEVDQTFFEGQSIPLNELLQAIVPYRRCFKHEYTTTPPWVPEVIRPTCPASEVAALRSLSELANYVVDETYNSGRLASDN